MRDIDTAATRAAIPADFPVQPLPEDENEWPDGWAQDGTCGLAWDDSASTSYTPAPSGRCPFEAFHEEGRYAVVEMHSEMGRNGHPAVNIKVNTGPQSVSLPLDLGGVSDADGSNFREVFTDPGFTHEWVDEHITGDTFESFWGDACEDHFEQAKELAAETFGSHVEVYTEGRSGGWLVVHGLGEVEDWDPELVEEWVQFAKQVREIADDVPHGFLWSVYANVYEPEQEAERLHAEQVAAGTDQHSVVLTTNQLTALLGVLPRGAASAEPLASAIGKLAAVLPGTAETPDDVTRVALPDGEVRIWAPEVHANDLGRMYVLDVFGASLLIREREDGLIVHVDLDGESAPAPDRGPLHVEVANGGENTYGDGE